MSSRYSSRVLPLKRCSAVLYPLLLKAGGRRDDDMLRASPALRELAAEESLLLVHVQRYLCGTVTIVVSLLPYPSSPLSLRSFSLFFFFFFAPCLVVMSFVCLLLFSFIFFFFCCFSELLCSSIGQHM